MACFGQAFNPLAGMDFIKAHSAEFIIGLSALFLLELWLIVGHSARLASVRRMVRGLLTGPGGEDLEAMLREHRAQSSQALERCDELASELTRLALQLRGCLQHTGLVRFDAYGDVSGQQSFSMALLDGNLDGVIVTSLFGRNDGRCYGKPVNGGKAELALSAEEAQALELALRDAGAKIPKR